MWYNIYMKGACHVRFYELFKVGMRFQQMYIEETIIRKPIISERYVKLMYVTAPKKYADYSTLRTLYPSKKRAIRDVGMGILGILMIVLLFAFIIGLSITLLVVATLLALTGSTAAFVKAGDAESAGDYESAAAYAMIGLDIEQAQKERIESGMYDGIVLAAALPYIAFYHTMKRIVLKAFRK